MSVILGRHYKEKNSPDYGVTRPLIEAHAQINNDREYIREEALRYQEAQEHRIQQLLGQIVKLKEQLKKTEEEQYM